MSKTTKEWFKGIKPKEARDQALKYLAARRTVIGVKYSTMKHDTFFEALSGSFIWRDTAEGHVYWSRIARKLN